VELTGTGSSYDASAVVSFDPNGPTPGVPTKTSSKLIRFNSVNAIRFVAFGSGGDGSFGAPGFWNSSGGGNGGGAGAWLRGIYTATLSAPLCITVKYYRYYKQQSYIQIEHQLSATKSIPIAKVYGGADAGPEAWTGNPATVPGKSGNGSSASASSGSPGYCYSTMEGTMSTCSGKASMGNLTLGVAHWPQDANGQNGMRGDSLGNTIILDPGNPGNNLTYGLGGAGGTNVSTAGGVGGIGAGGGGGYACRSIIAGPDGLACDGLSGIAGNGGRGEVRIWY
jgi:hypothetical protein